MKAHNYPSEIKRANPKLLIAIKPQESPTGHDYNSAYSYSYQHPQQAKLNIYACPVQTPEFQVLKSEVAAWERSLKKF